jgi:hypothetical protein
MRVALKIFLTVAIAFNLMGAALPPKTCGMPCCSQVQDEATQVCGHCSPVQLKAPEAPPCCQIKAAADTDPATVNSAQAEMPLPDSSHASGPAFAVNTGSEKIPYGTGSPPGSILALPVYKLTSAYLC